MPISAIEEPKFCTKVVYSKHTSTITWIVVFVLTFLALQFSEKTRDILVRPNMLFIPWAFLISLNLLSFYQNPTRLTSAKKCSFPLIGEIRCDLQNAISASFCSTFDCLTLFLLTGSITNNLPFRLILSCAVWGICQLYIWTIYNSEGVYEQHKFEFLPAFLACKNTRVAIYVIVLILGIVSFYQAYIGDRPMDRLVANPLNKFGGWGKSKFDHAAFILGIIVGIISLWLDYAAMDGTMTYDPKDYDLPENVQLKKLEAEM